MSPGTADGDVELRFVAADSLWEAVQGGRRVGHLHVIDCAPHEVVLVAPRQEPGLPTGPIGRALVGAARSRARDDGVARIELIVEDRSLRSDEVAQEALRWGFTFDQAKRVYRAEVAALRREGVAMPTRTEWVPATSAADPLLVSTLDRVQAIDAAHFLVRPGETVSSFLDHMATRCRRDGCYHPDDWAVLRIDGAPAGVVLPAFVDAEHRTATNLTLGLVPAFRGRGLGAALVLHGVDTMARRGATRYLGSCDARNAPMIRTFERLGCRVIAEQRIFEDRLRG